MAARNLLHITKLEDFKAWLGSKGIQHRPGVGDWQALQVRFGTGWAAIYTTARASEHFSVQVPLAPMVRRYIRERHNLATTYADPNGARNERPSR